MPPESSQPTDFSIDPRHPAYGTSVSKQFEVASGIYLRRMWWTDKQLRCTEAIRHVKYSTIYIWLKSIFEFFHCQAPSWMQRHFSIHPACHLRSRRPYRHLEQFQFTAGNFRDSIRNYRKLEFLQNENVALACWCLAMNFILVPQRLICFLWNSWKNNHDLNSSGAYGTLRALATAGVSRVSTCLLRGAITNAGVVYASNS
jgi:hypothetical protein